MPAKMAYHYHKIHVALHLSGLNLRKAMVLLMMLLAAYNTECSANGIKLQQSHSTPHFNHLELRNTMVPLTALSASYYTRAGANGVT